MSFPFCLQVVHFIPARIEIQVHDAWIAEVQVVTKYPRDEDKSFANIVFSTPSTLFAQVGSANGRKKYQSSLITWFLWMW